MKVKRKNCRLCHERKPIKKGFGINQRTGRRMRRCRACPPPHGVKVIGR